MKSWKTWLGVALSCFFFYMAVHNVDWGLFAKSLRSVDLSYIVLVMVIVLSTLLMRGFRWVYFLKPIRRCSPIALFWSTTIGFAINNVLPARLGEVARAYSVYKKMDVPFGSALGSIVVERLYDTFMVLFLFVLALAFFEFENFHRIFPVSQGRVAFMFGMGGFALLAMVLALKIKTELFIKIARFFTGSMPTRLQDKLLGFFRSFVKGLTQSTDPLEVFWIIFISVAIWIVSGFSMYLCVLAFGISLSMEAVIILMMAIVAAVAIPAAPGYVGVYHYLAQQALVVYVGMDLTQALSIAVVIHAANYIPQTLVGLMRFAYEGIKITDLKTVRSSTQK